MSSTTTLDGIFKQNYDTGSQVFEEQQNLMAYCWKKFKVSALKPTPQGIQMPVSMRGNESGSAINEEEGFRTPQSLQPIRPSITPKRVVWPFEVTGSAIELSETDKQAFAGAIDAQQKDNLARMMSDLNRQSLSAGTGQMSLVNGAVVVAAVVAVDNPFRFRANMVLDAFDTLAGGGIKEIDARTVIAVDYDASTITFDQNVSCSDNAILVKAGIHDGAPVDGKELSGLQKICDTTAFGNLFEGVDATTFPEWQGNVVDGLAAPISQNLLQRTEDRAAVVGGSRPDLLVSNYGQARTFLNTEIQKTRYEATKIEGGKTVLKWNNMEWMLEKDYDLGEVGLFNSNHVYKFQTKDVHLAQHDGKVVQRVTGFDKVAGYYVYYGNLGTWKRNAHARIINLQEPSF